ncbi:MAG: DUF5657 family protein [Weeksellaceae bacterium]
MEEFFAFFNSAAFFTLFFKAFAVFFAFFYLIYAIIITRQTQIMNKTLSTHTGPIIFALSFLQIIFALLLIIASLTLL